MVKRTRGAATSPASKTPMEESADALAGVEGALKGGKRKATSSAGPKKKTAKKSEEAVSRSRSDSMNELAEVAGTLLKEDAESDALATAAAVAAAAASVPDPMAALPEAKPPPASAAVATGFRKKGTAAKTSAPPPPPPLLETTQAIPKAKPIATVIAKPDAVDKKAQIQYNPDIPMTKEQLTAWRREMRRVRNRESAAASRRKVRDRIEELEEEVDVWKKRYQEVLGRLGEKGEFEDEAKKKTSATAKKAKDSSTAPDPMFEV